MTSNPALPITPPTETEIHGVPEWAAGYHRWITDDNPLMVKKGTDDGIKPYELQEFIDFHESGGWILSKVWRQKLYKALFYEFDRGWKSEPIANYIIDSEINTIHNIQGYFLYVIKELYSEASFQSSPPLHEFVDDCERIARILMFRLPEESATQEFDQVQICLDQIWDKWNDRWTGVSEKVCEREIVRHYCCGLIDVMFGIWPRPSQFRFHNRESDITDLSRTSSVGCLQSSFYFWKKEESPITSPRSNLPTKDSVSLIRLDANNIETNGPYRFVPTDQINEHLLVRDQTILIFVDWTRFLMLQYHRVTVAEAKISFPVSNVSRFHLLTGSKRSRQNRFQCRMGDLRFISYELMDTYLVLFGGLFPDPSASKLAVWKNKITRSYAKIAERLGLDLNGAIFEKYKKDSAEQEAQFTESARFEMFRERLETLNKELGKWKPIRLGELLYTGYGGIDPLALYGLYFSVAFGVVSLLLLFFTIALTGLTVKLVYP
jgi:hypothetical protein